MFEVNELEFWCEALERMGYRPTTRTMGLIGAALWLPEAGRLLMSPSDVKSWLLQDWADVQPAPRGHNFSLFDVGEF